MFTRCSRIRFLTRSLLLPLCPSRVLTCFSLDTVLACYPVCTISLLDVPSCSFRFEWQDNMYPFSSEVSALTVTLTPSEMWKYTRTNKPWPTGTTRTNIGRTSLEQHHQEAAMAQFYTVYLAVVLLVFLVHLLLETALNLSPKP